VSQDIPFDFHSEQSIGVFVSRGGRGAQARTSQLAGCRWWKQRWCCCRMRIITMKPTRTTAPAKGTKAPTEPKQAKPAAPASKISQVIAHLERPGGATLAELVAATGWQPHTARAALAGLRKKGHVITKGAGDGVTAYQITKAA
jgi:hypothetical protein